MKNLLFLSLLFTALSLQAQQVKGDYFVSVNGDDNNPGTYEKPWGTWQKAFSEAKPGDTVYFRGGTWYPTEVTPGANTPVMHSPVQEFIRGHNGEENNRICFFNYPGEVPILDCSKLDTVGRRFNGGVTLISSSYLHLKGLTITNVYQPHSRELASGIGASECSNLIFENLTVKNIGGRGMSYWGVAGHPEVPEIKSDTTKYINCDVYNCIDSLSEVPGNGSDGWKLDNESKGYLFFYGCRAWNCGDDGFDISGPGVTIFDNCWSFNHQMPGAIDGNGFKFGANRGNGAKIDNNGEVILGTPVQGVRKIVRNCISVNNIGVGYYDLGYEPYYPNNSRVYNNISYKNGIGIQIILNEKYSGQNPGVYRNNIIYQPTQNDAGGRPYYLVVGDIYIESNNNWDYADDTEIGSLMWWKPTDSVKVTNDDFVSLDYSQLSKPRKADGSLPDITFMKPVPGSDLIDAGTDVGLPYYGKNPDIGYAEYNPNISAIKNKASGKFSVSCYPNPTSDIVNIVCSADVKGKVNIVVIDVTGNEILTENVYPDLNSNKREAYEHTIDLTSFVSGVYCVVLNGDEFFRSIKVVKR